MIYQFTPCIRFWKKNPLLFIPDPVIRFWKKKFNPPVYSNFYYWDFEKKDDNTRFFYPLFHLLEFENISKLFSNPVFFSFSFLTVEYISSLLSFIFLFPSRIPFISPSFSLFSAQFSYFSSSPLVNFDQTEYLVNPRKHFKHRWNWIPNN